MLKKIGLYLVIAAFALQSCSVNTETTYYKDSASSMQSNVLVDKGMMGMFSMMNNGESMPKTAEDYGNLTTNWQSLYDLQKDGKITLNEKEVGALKKVYLKLNKNQDEVSGFSLKYDKLLPVEIAQLFASKKELKKIPLQDFARWDGNKLEIDTEKFNISESLAEIQNSTKEETTPRSKQDSIVNYGKQMASGMVGMLRMFNLNFTNTLKFQKPIKSIQGKHDFVEQIDPKTIRVNVRTAEMWDQEKLKNKDKKIVIITE